MVVFVKKLNLFAQLYFVIREQNESKDHYTEYDIDTNCTQRKTLNYGINVHIRDAYINNQTHQRLQ